MTASQTRNRRLTNGLESGVCRRNLTVTAGVVPHTRRLFRAGAGGG